MDVGTVMWMVGLLLAVGALVFELAGPGPATGAVGVVLVAEGVFADLAGPKRGGN